MATHEHIVSALQHHDNRLLEVAMCFCFPTDETIALLVSKCPQLRRLNLVNCQSLTEASAQAIADGCAQLVELNLTWCGGSPIADMNLGDGKMPPSLSRWWRDDVVTEADQLNLFKRCGLTFQDLRVAGTICEFRCLLRQLRKQAKKQAKKGKGKKGRRHGICK